MNKAKSVFKVFTSSEQLWPSLKEKLFILDREQFPNPWSNMSWDNFFLTQSFMLGILFQPFEQEEENVVWGFSFFQVQYADSFAHLLKIIVDKNHQKNGFGGQMLDDSLSYLRSQGVHHFYLEVECENIAAQGLYLSHGFQVIHRNKNFYGCGRDALIMTLD